MKKLLLLFAIGLSSAAVAQDTLPPPFPRVNATKLLETDRIVVWNIVWPKGQPTALHRHVYDQVGTYYARGGRTITTPDGNARQAMTEVGSLSTTRKGTTHIEEGNTDPPLQAVFIELKKDTPSGAWSAGASELAGATQTFDDARVRVWDVTLSRGHDVTYRPASDAVTVYLADGRLQVTGSDGKSEDLSIRPGTMRYLKSGVEERLRVLEGAPRVMVFEIK
jgi:hypothetical protein